MSVTFWHAVVLQVVALLADLLGGRAGVAMPGIDGVGVTEPTAERGEVDQPAARIALDQRRRDVIARQVPPNSTRDDGSK
jgi:hypothetical protein